jgi:signal transduction histidine kinase
MKSVFITENSNVVLAIAVTTILFIGYVDLLTGAEFGFSFFYLIPISLMAIHKATKLRSVIFCAVLSAILWFAAECWEGAYSMLFFPIWNGTVRLIIFNAIGLLIYDLKEKDNKLKELNSKLLTINEEKNKFIGIAAHDTRSPLGVIYSLSDIILVDYKERLNAEIIEILDIIKKTSKKSLTIIENLLDVSKIESGQLIIQKKHQDFIHFVKNQIYINRILAQNKEIEIVLITDYEQVLLDFDEHYFSEVIDNLLSNAIKYSNRNTEIQVIVSVNNNRLRTEVVDNGIGISETEQQNLFKYFQTTSSRPTEGEESTGLGLAISKQIVNLHQGSIGVRSAKNQGSTFFFELPMRQE